VNGDLSASACAARAAGSAVAERRSVSGAWIRGDERPGWTSGGSGAVLGTTAPLP
jgi:hypothetical protein